MPVKIRLQRRGRKQKPFYHIVVADARAPRDGRFIEKIGTYNPMTKPATIDLDRDLAFDWLMKGAQPTDTARAILRFKGVLYRKHLMRGVKKGALTQEQADEMYAKWISDKEAKVVARREASEEEIRQYHATISGTAKPIAKTVAEEAEHAPAPEEARSFAESVEQTTVESVTEEVTEEAPAAEEAAPAAEAEETPAAEEAPETPPAEEKKEE